ncbi:unnamed protein product, partial [Linum tenue]
IDATDISPEISVSSSPANQLAAHRIFQGISGGREARPIHRCSTLSYELRCRHQVHEEINRQVRLHSASARGREASIPRVTQRNGQTISSRQESSVLLLACCKFAVVVSSQGGTVRLQ